MAFQYLSTLNKEQKMPFRSKVGPSFEEPVVDTPTQGEMWVTGDAQSTGTLGLGNTTDYSSPVQLGSSTNWKEHFGGKKVNFAIGGGKLFGWGEGHYGYSGHNNTTDYSSPVQIGALTTWEMGNAGRRVALAIRTDGKMYAWGSPNYGALGTGSGSAVSSPTLVLGGKSDWDFVAADTDWVGGIDDSGRLFTWGRGTYGAIGNGATDNVTSPVQIGSSTDWVKLQAAGGMTGIRSTGAGNGTLFTWGSGQSGRNGRGDTTNVSSPVQVGSLTDWKSIVGGGDWMGALKHDGTMWGWGNSIMTGGNGGGSSPVQIGTDTNWESISMGYSQNTLARKTNGKLYVWGRGTAGCLGTGATANVAAPVQIGVLTTWKSFTRMSQHAQASAMFIKEAS